MWIDPLVIEEFAMEQLELQVYVKLPDGNETNLTRGGKSRM